MVNHLTQGVTKDGNAIHHVQVTVRTKSSTSSALYNQSDKANRTELESFVTFDIHSFRINLHSSRDLPTSKHIPPNPNYKSPDRTVIEALTMQLSIILSSLALASAFPTNTTLANRDFKFSDYITCPDIRSVSRAASIGGTVYIACCLNDRYQYLANSFKNDKDKWLQCAGHVDADLSGGPILPGQYTGLPEKGQICKGADWGVCPGHPLGCCKLKGAQPDCDGGNGCTPPL